MVQISADDSQVVARHEILRTVFVEKDGEPIQQIRDSFSIRVEQVSLDGTGDDEVRRELEAWSRETFDLA